MRRLLLTITGLAALLAATLSCEQVSINEVQPHAPVVTGFTPASAPAGAIVVVTGEYLNNVNAARIGNVPVDIVERVSNTRLSVRVGQDVTSGVITLTNAVGSGSSEASFSCTFAVPSLTASLLPEQADMGEEILLSGTNLNSVREVLFTADGHEGHAATVVSCTDDEMVIKVPYVEEASAKIILSYFDGSSVVKTPAASAPAMTVVRYVPTFDDYTLVRTAVGMSVVLTGKNLQNVEKVLVGGFEAFISATPERLSFTVPAGDFQDGTTTVPVEVIYFAGNEKKVLDPAFEVYVPFVKYWENISLVAQGRTAASSYTSFFSPETGRAYPNKEWATVLDPVAMTYKMDMWASANVHKNVKAEEYSSVVPYFFFSANSAGPLQINSPANSSSQIRNFFVSFEGTPAADYRVPGGQIDIAGTPVLTFRYLSSAKEAENAIRQMVISGNMEKLDEEVFPIDVANKKIAGVDAPTAGSVNSKTWLPDFDAEAAVKENPLSDHPGVKPSEEAIILVCYYGPEGYNAESPASNIRRIGLIQITQVDWIQYVSGSTKNYGGSIITFNCYWQKYDYDYTKL